MEGGNQYVVDERPGCLAAFGWYDRRRDLRRIVGIWQMINVVSLLFGCRHRHVTRPITLIARRADPNRETYVACLDCGKHFRYDPVNMRVGKRIDRDATPPMTR